MVKKKTTRRKTASTKPRRTTTSARKTNIKRKTSPAKSNTANPFKGADFVKQNANTYKVQSVVANSNGLKVKEKVVKRTPKTDRQFSALKRG